MNSNSFGFVLLISSNRNGFMKFHFPPTDIKLEFLTISIAQVNAFNMFDFPEAFAPYIAVVFSIIFYYLSI